MKVRNRVANLILLPVWLTPRLASGDFTPVLTHKPDVHYDDSRVGASASL